MKNLDTFNKTILNYIATTSTVNDTRFKNVKERASTLLEKGTTEEIVSFLHTVKNADFWPEDTKQLLNSVDFAHKRLNQIVAKVSK